jgi:DNA-directed RNA polymerase subunit RPC12/RpoP
MSDSAGGFLGVFEQRVHRLRKRLKDELEKDKPERCRNTLKLCIKEIKEWEEVLQKHQKAHNRCPHCGEKLDL